MPVSTDRFPAKPILKEGYPKNVTALANSTVTFECPVLTDLAVWVQWAKYHAYNETDNKIIRNEVAFEVGCGQLNLFKHTLVSVFDHSVNSLRLWDDGFFY